VAPSNSPKKAKPPKHFNSLTENKKKRDETKTEKRGAGDMLSGVQQH